MLRYAYFPGCSMQSTGTTYRQSIEFICRKTGLELLEIPDWSCCGATSGHAKGKYLALALAARSIALAEARLAGLDICVPCAACYSRLRYATASLRGGEREKLQKIVGMPAEGRAEILSLMDVLTTEEALEAIARAVVRPLTGLRVACYYGCLTSRPSGITGAADTERPMRMDRLVALTGAEPVQWDYKTECCGASHQVDAPTAARPLIARIFENAQANGARAVCTACPVCNLNLDMREEEINRAFGRGYDLPVYQFTELLAVSMGASAVEIGLHKHFYPAFDRLNDTLRRAAAGK